MDRDIYIILEDRIADIIFNLEQFIRDGKGRPKWTESFEGVTLYEELQSLAGLRQTLSRLAGTNDAVATSLHGEGE